MQYGNKTIAWVSLALSLLSSPAGADNLKDLITSAIVNGKSTGYLDADIAAKYGATTKSNEPVMITVERLEQYSDKCALLAVMTGQAGVRDAKGKTGILNLAFKLPICIDGTYPESVKALDEERRKPAFKKCRQTVVHVDAKGGFTQGSIEFKNCPANGVVDLFYDGSCEELNPGPNAVVKEFKFDGNGSLSIQMMIPKSCMEKSKTINKWQLYIFERRALMYPKELVGIRPVFW